MQIYNWNVTCKHCDDLLYNVGAVEDARYFESLDKLVSPISHLFLMSSNSAKQLLRKFIHIQNCFSWSILPKIVLPISKTLTRSDSKLYF